MPNGSFLHSSDMNYFLEKGYRDKYNDYSEGGGGGGGEEIRY